MDIDICILLDFLDICVYMQLIHFLHFRIKGKFDTFHFCTLKEIAPTSLPLGYHSATTRLYHSSLTLLSRHTFSSYSLLPLSLTPSLSAHSLTLISHHTISLLSLTILFHSYLSTDLLTFISHHILPPFFLTTLTLLSHPYLSPNSLTLISRHARSHSSLTTLFHLYLTTLSHPSVHHTLSPFSHPETGSFSVAVSV